MIGTSSITLGAPTAIEMATDPTSGALVATAVSQTQAQTDNVTRFRYDFTSGNWSPGTATITIPTWKDSGGDVAGVTTLTFEVLGPTVQLVQPTNGSGIDVNTINGRTYVDVDGDRPVVRAVRLDDRLGCDLLRRADRHAERPGRRLGHDRHEPGCGDHRPDADERHRALRDRRLARRVGRRLRHLRHRCAAARRRSRRRHRRHRPGRGRPGRADDRRAVPGRHARTCGRLPGRHRLARRLQPVHAHRHGPRDGHDRPVVHAGRRRRRLHDPLPRDRRARERRRRGLRDVRARHVVGEAGERRLVDDERRDDAERARRSSAR